MVGIGDKVSQDAEQPDSEATLHWLEFAENMLELAGPITHEASSTVAGVIGIRSLDVRRQRERRAESGAAVQGA